MPELLPKLPDSTVQLHVLLESIEHEIVINKSRFIAFVAPVIAVPAADDLLRQRKSLHPNARHHCSALVLGTPIELQRSNDDGEPAGTAGIPMANALRGREMTDVLAVVTRYFGGIKLGAGGLVRAYGAAVTEALDVAADSGILFKRVVQEVSEVELGYELAGVAEAQIRNFADSHQIQVAEVNYGAVSVHMRLAHQIGKLPEIQAQIAQITSGSAEVKTLGWQYRDLPL